MTNLIRKSVNSDGTINLEIVASILNTSISEVLTISGVDSSFIDINKPLDNEEDLRKVKIMLEIIDTVLPWSGSEQNAYTWYRNEVIPSFGTTSEEMVRLGHSDQVKQYLARIAVGGFA